MNQDRPATGCVLARVDLLFVASVVVARRADFTWIVLFFSFQSRVVLLLLLRDINWDGYY